MRKKIVFFRDWEQMPLVLTPEEVAQLLNLNAQTIRKYARENIIPSIKVGNCHRFDRDVIKNYIKERSESNA
ncbi:MAG: helix-turn-helix domain-containing protein [Clostridia bacterium]|nr:helix-turn-helix domain-containing protein [Clostridia bacterium]